MKKVLKYFIVLVLILASVVGYFAYQTIYGAYIENDTTLNLKSDADYNDLLALLNENKLIKNPFIFNLLADKMNLSTHVHSGKYQFKKGSSLYYLIASLRGGWQEPVVLTINNVNFKADLCGKIGKQLEIDSLYMYACLSNDALIESFGYTKDNILCMFIPNTYEFYWNVSLAKFLAKIQSENEAFWNEVRNAQAMKIGLTKKEVYILASIVEKEYKFGEERATIAGVYLNRIKLGMKLQADPTVKFALGDLSLKRILTVHTEYDNPYNTYFYQGLPPGPICMPETSTIDAVLNAEKHDYLYFCAKEDLSGYHVFNTNYDAHLKTAKLYQAALNKMKIYE